MSPISEETPGTPTPTTAHPAPGGAGRDRGEDRAGREPGELVVALSPRQIIGGFALVAGLLIWLRRRGRRKG